MMPAPLTQVDGGAAEPETPAPAQRKSAPAAVTAPNTAMLETDDEDLRLALQMSMVSITAALRNVCPFTCCEGAIVAFSVSLSADRSIRALRRVCVDIVQHLCASRCLGECIRAQCCMQGDTEEKGGTSSSTGGGVVDMLQDSEYMKSLLGSLPGVDPSDEALQGALASLSKKEDFKHMENKEKEKDKDKQ